MQRLRSLLFRHPVLVLAIGLSALALRLAVPAGFMPVLDHGRYVLAPCPDQGPAAAEPTSGIAEKMPGMAHSGEGDAQARSSCAFADLSLPAIGGAGAAQPAAAFVFAIVAAPFLAALSPRRSALRLRPPLRGPPLPR